MMRAARSTILAALITSSAACTALDTLDGGMAERECYRNARSMAEHAECRAEYPPERASPAERMTEPVRSLERRHDSPRRAR